MSHKKIKSLNIESLEKILANAINEKLGVKYSINISSIEYTNNGSEIDDQKVDITNISLSINNKVIDNRDYSGKF